MKIRLFLAVLLTLGIAAAGLFLLYNGYFNKPNYTENSQKEDKNEPVGDINIKKQIKVDLGQQRMYLFENGQIVKEYAISSGKPDTPTPTGNFRVIYKQDMAYSKPTGCWLAFWVGFTSDGRYGFHETPVCEGKRIGEDKIGTPDSAGCIRLKLGDSEDFYTWVEIETPVTIEL